MRDPNTQIRPLISVAVTKGNSSDIGQLQQACEELARQYPDISVETDPATLQSIVRGVDESHLKSVCDEILERELDVVISEPKVIYLRMPCSIELMRSFGITPPSIKSIKSKSSPHSVGSRRILAWP